MKISAKLKIAVFVPVFMALIIGLTLVYSYRVMEKAWENGDIVRRIRTKVTEINHVVHSYMLYHEERPKQQFRAEHDSLMRLIGSAEFTNPVQQIHLNNIRRDSEIMQETFLRLASHYERREEPGSDELFRDVEERLVGQLLVRLHGVDSDASLLRSLVDENIRKTQEKIIVLVFLSMALAIVPITIVLFRTKRSIDASLTKLRTGTETVGAGNLDYRIGIPGGDELADLARSFDAMTGRLQEVTVSQDELQKEVEERKKAEEALKRGTLQLQEANSELEAFSYSVSHDLRAPLRAIDGFTKMLLKDANHKLDNEEKRKFDVIRDNARKMGQLIDDLLAFSRVGRDGISLSELDIGELVQEVWKEQRALEPGRDLEFEVAFLPRPIGDRALIRQVLANILANAIKYTRQQKTAVIRMGGESKDSENIYYVKDNGAGFDMKYHDKLFGVFQRLHPENEYEGTGVGLAIVQRIIHRHGGRVWAEGEPGKGATFYFSLPSAPFAR